MLDLKYRPTKFSDVIGNDGVKRLLKIRSKNKTLDHQSMMFGGPKGCGKTTLARIVARAIRCSNVEDGEPCGECEKCLSIINDTSFSVEELDAASQGTVDKIRSMVKDSDYGSPDGSATNVYILDEAQRLSKAAQDALLKAIESRLFIVILCTTEPHKIGGPIRDRLEEYPIHPPTKDELIARLKNMCEIEKIEIEDQALPIIVQMTGNTPRSSILSIETLSQLGPITVNSVKDHYRFDSYKLIDEILNLVDSDVKSAFLKLDRLFGMESPIWVRDNMVFAISSGVRLDIGAKSSFPVPIRFFQTRLMGWTKFAKILSSFVKPTCADIESSLLSDSFVSYRSVTPLKVELQERGLLDIPAEPKIVLPEMKQEKIQVKPEVKPEKVLVKRSKEIEIDGIKFSESEKLTSLDSKIKGTDSQPAIETDNSVRVLSDNNRVPISEKEFSSYFRKF